MECRLEQTLPAVQKQLTFLAPHPEFVHLSVDPDDSSLLSCDKICCSSEFCRHFLVKKNRTQKFWQALGADNQVLEEKGAVHFSQDLRQDLLQRLRRRESESLFFSELSWLNACVLDLMWGQNAVPFVLHFEKLNQEILYNPPAHTTHVVLYQFRLSSLQSNKDLFDAIVKWAYQSEFFLLVHFQQQKKTTREERLSKYLKKTDFLDSFKKSVWASTLSMLKELNTLTIDHGIEYLDGPTKTR